MNQKTRILLSLVIAAVCLMLVGAFSTAGIVAGSCVDSDGGGVNEIYKKGSVKYKIINFDDSIETRTACIDECYDDYGCQKIYECSCSGSSSTAWKTPRVVTCVNGGGGGACYPPSSTTQPTTTTSTQSTTTTTFFDLPDDLCISEECEPVDEDEKLIIFAFGAGALLILRPWKP